MGLGEDSDRESLPEAAFPIGAPKSGLRAFESAWAAIAKCHLLGIPPGSPWRFELAQTSDLRLARFKLTSFEVQKVKGAGLHLPSPAMIQTNLVEENFHRRSRCKRSVLCSEPDIVLVVPMKLEPRRDLFKKNQMQH